MGLFPYRFLFRGAVSKFSNNTKESPLPKPPGKGSASQNVNQQQQQQTGKTITMQIASDHAAAASAADATFVSLALFLLYLVSDCIKKRRSESVTDFTSRQCPVARGFFSSLPPRTMLIALISTGVVHDDSYPFNCTRNSQKLPTNTQNCSK